MIEFFIPMKLPSITLQEQKIGVRNGKPYKYDPPELKAARALFRDHLAYYAPDAPLTGPVRLHTIWCYQSDAHKKGEWKTTKPDTDNSLKLLKDVMTQLGFWKDDAQVSSELTEKIWNDFPGLYVSVEALT
jgi:Holliday junction resolvase